jgi:hypothetical protein
MHSITNSAEGDGENILSKANGGRANRQNRFFSYQIGSNRIKSAHPNHPRGLGIKSNPLGPRLTM